jgi:hypothetical protein
MVGLGRCQLQVVLVTARSWKFGVLFWHSIQVYSFTPNYQKKLREKRL